MTSELNIRLNNFEALETYHSWNGFNFVTLYNRKKLETTKEVVP